MGPPIKFQIQPQRLTPDKDHERGYTIAVKDRDFRRNIDPIFRQLKFNPNPGRPPDKDGQEIEGEVVEFHGLPSLLFSFSGFEIIRKSWA